MLNKAFTKFQDKSRKKKFDLFIKILAPTKETKILDVGCGEGTFLEDLYIFRNNITALDISDRNIKAFKKNYPGIKIFKNNAKYMQFKAKSFDIIFSNAVIEHVGGFNEQKKYAREIRRVGRSYFITTPNKWFPFEPHYRLPLFQFVPKKIQRILANFFSLGNYPKGYWESINLISSSQLKKLFPEATIIKQKVSFLPETLIAIYNNQRNPK